MSRIRRIAIVSSLLAVAFASVARASEYVYAASAYDAGGVSVLARSIKLDKKGKIWFKVTVVNHTGKPMTIDANQISARLPDGRTLAREIGVFGGKKIYDVPSGLSHPLDIEFKIGEVPLQVTLGMKGFIVGGVPLELPDFVASPTGGK